MDQVIKRRLRVIFHFLSFASLMIFFTSHTEAAQEIIAIQSIHAEPYEEAFQGFTQACNATKVQRLVISETQGRDPVTRLSETPPDLILAIGMGALSRVRNFPDVPVVYVMVLDAGIKPSSKNHITGVKMRIAPEHQLSALLDVLPETKKVGLLYDPRRTETLVSELRTTAKPHKISIEQRWIQSPKNVPDAIMEIGGKIDALWMLPDLTVVTPETIEFFLLFSLENKIPIITFSEKYVELGALMSIGVDPFDLGRQAGEIAKKVLSGTDISTIQEAYARKAVITINDKIARKLGIAISEKITIKAKIID